MLKKYFVAGVICNKCKVQDTIQVERFEDKIVQTCVECWHQEVILQDSTIPAQKNLEAIELKNIES